jgi:signal transduction histidine kinase/ligand-binding sensor domain-containing protein
MPTRSAAVVAVRSARTGGSLVSAVATVAALLCTPAGLPAQVVNFQHYTSAEGIPQAQVFAITQDRHGYIWFGTYGGVSRFDGRHFRTYEAEDGLISNSVFDVVEAPDGSLLFGTSRGLCIFENGAFRCYGREEGLLHDDVRTVAADDSSGIWVGGSRGAAYLRHGAVRNFGPDDGLPGERIARIAIDSTGQVWVATNRGLARYADGRFIADTPGVFSGAVQFVRAAAGGVLVGSEGRLYLRNGAAAQRIAAGTIPDGVAFTDGVVDDNGTIWLATRSGVLRIVDGMATRFGLENGLRTELINRVTVDREGLVWFGTESGASKHVPGPFLTYTEASGLPSPFVRAVTSEPSGRLWIGGRNGIAYRDGDRFVPVPLPGLRDNRVFGLFADTDGLLVGAVSGLVHWTARGTRIYGMADGLPHEVVYCMESDGEGGIWIGTPRGLAHWQRGRITRVTHAALDGVGIIAMRRDSRGRLWMGTTDAGVAVLEGDSVWFLDASNGGTDRTIWAVTEDADGRIWAGTNGDGVLRIGEDGIVRLTMRDGLASNFIWQVMADSRGDVWLFGNKGLNRIRGNAISHFGRGSGLLELEGSAGAAHEDGHGSLWFGTGAGLIRYTPGLHARVAAAPPIYIEEATVAGEPFGADRSAEVHIPRGTIRIRFAAPSFRDESAIRFRYRLVGSGDGWSNEASDESITYAGLAPGHYRFEVVAVDGGLASAAPAVLAFHVTPAFWQTWWFRTLVAVLLLGLAAAAPALWARSLEHERRRLEALVAWHTRELAEKNARLEASNDDLEYFAYIASHDLQEPLRKIQAFSDRIRGQYKDRLDEQGQDYLSRMTDAASRMQRLINDLLNLSRVSTRVQPMSHVALTPLVQEVVSDLEIRLAATKGRVDIGELPTVFGDAVQLRQLFQNLIGNALKFHKPDEAPVVRVSAAHGVNGMAGIRVEDNGIGFDAKDAERVFQPFLRLHGRTKYEGSGIGLAICQKIVQRHRGSIRAESAPGIGTRFIMTLPTSAPVETEGAQHAA